MNNSNRFAVVLLILASVAAGSPARSQDSPTSETVPETVADPDKEIATPEQVQVDPVAEDEDISQRLTRIFEATGWFQAVDISTDEGVVFLAGEADTEQHREWAERVGQRTSDVVAVVNRITVIRGPIWDISPAIAQLKQLLRDLIQIVPLLIVGFLIIIIAYGLAKLSASATRRVSARRVDSQLLQQVASSIVAVIVMLIGLYIALKVSGLSRLAVTVLGGTGLIGLALGFAFRDIAENYLASILISLNRPFNVGDLIELDSYKGFVRRVTTRGTVLLTAEGNHIQIPNSTVYKTVVTNFSSSPRVRKEFSIGIGYDDNVSEAQDVILRTLTEHQAILGDPKPLVLVDSLGASTVNLKVLYWLDSQRFDAASVSSALMRQTKTALTDANISMPDEAREVVFPDGVPVAMLDGPERKKVSDSSSDERERVASVDRSDSAHSNGAEGGLENTDAVIQQHAATAEFSDEENLIE